MIKPDLIIFDCDGVLVDSEVLSCHCLSAVLAGYGIDLGVEQALDLFLGRNTAAVMTHYQGLGRPIPERFSAELGAGVRAAFRRRASSDRRRGRRAGGAPHAVLRRLVERSRSRIVLPFRDRSRVAFRRAALYLANGGTHGKPAPDLFLYAADEMRADPRRTLVIEDSVSGVAAGKAAGMTVWGFVGGSHYQSRDGRTVLYNAGADRVFERMADFWPEQAEGLDGRA